MAKRVYCIGDIHGRADLLTHLHELILKDARRYQGDKTIVYLGDCIDRGEQSRQVIEMLLSQPLPGFEAIYLKGNHEQAMLDFMEYPEAAAAWLTFGGRETLNSYGIPVPYIPTLKEIPSLAEKLRQEWHCVIDEIHKKL
jgi:serine/threonine protein phosphatase 1